MKTLLALDVATVTGWAFGPVGAGTKPSVSGALKFGPAHTIPPDERWYKAQVWLAQQIAVLNPDIVAIEAPIQSSHMGGNTNPNTTMLLLGLQATLRSVVYWKLPTSAKLLNVQEVRKLFVGGGRIPSKEAKQLVKSRCIELGWVDENTATYDQCDACAVWAKAAWDMSADFRFQFPALKTKFKPQSLLERPVF